MRSVLTAIGSILKYYSGLPGFNVDSSGLNVGTRDVGGDKNPNAHDSGQILDEISLDIAFILFEASKKFSEAYFASIKSLLIISLRYFTVEICD